jgi:MFS family permease
MALAASGVCCFISPFLWMLPLPLFLTVMLIWGFAVVADSPQFSALVATNAPLTKRGTALTTVTCIGFSITIVSIQIVSRLEEIINPDFVLLALSLGPIVGLIFFKKERSRTGNK